MTRYAPVIEARASSLRQQVVRVAPSAADDKAYQFLRDELFGHQGKACSMVHPGVSHDDFMDRREEEEEEKRTSAAKLLGPTPEVRFLGPDGGMVSVNSLSPQHIRPTIQMAEMIRRATGGKLPLTESHRRQVSPRTQRFLENIATSDLTEMERGRYQFLAAFHNIVGRYGRR